MKLSALFALTMLATSLMAVHAEAQWSYRPVQVTPRYQVRVNSPRYAPPVTQRPVYFAPGPARVSSGPRVVYEPKNVVYSRRRPILGGYSVRVRPAYRRTVIW